MENKLLSVTATAEKVQQYIIYCEAQRAEKNDSGSNGKIFDVLGRAYVNKRLRSNDVKCRKAEKNDCKFMGNDGKYHTIEFKTGCSPLAYEYDLDVVNFDLMLDGVEYICYNPEYCKNMEVEQQGFVMTREQFLNILIDYKPNKPLTWFKVNKTRRQVNIQSFTNSRPKYEYLLDCMYEYPTLEEFIEEMR